MTAQTQLRIGRLAADPAVHRAFGWLHLHQLQLRQWQLEMLGIPAPSFGEGARASWFVERFQQLGLANVHLDATGNALGELPCLFDRATEPGTPKAVVLISAHLDTVFSANTPTAPSEVDSRIEGPGACDNAAGLTALLALAAALRHANLTPAATILFVANVGEEGEGDLRGMRHIFATKGDRPSLYAGRIAAAIALEGSGSTAVVTQALGSRRFRVTVTGPGGHSWTDAGAPNPILLLAQALLAVTESPSLTSLPGATPRTTLNVGCITGGTSVNSIPESASALLDLRSTDPNQLSRAEAALRATLGSAIRQADAVRLAVELIGDRPAGALPAESPLLATLRAVDRHLSLRTELRTGSTDANIPLSLGVPAIAIGAGGLGGGIHTLAEWYDPTGREVALRRILLTLLDTAHVAASSE